ncbi:translation repressor RelB [Bombiscardovia nodaiensis]|uniref:Translation repressor RelB n=1 Tax=Bombiscardovia nodaiensis TaxID=2932181 RepID=A0ABM8B6L5_9BIFI|nr:translation repressor RelB [Bombiscardovia nodaiensis]
MATTTIRMNDELKARASAVLESMGLNFNTFVNMASVQLVNQKRIPFDIIEPGSTAPAVGHTAANGIRFEGTSDDGYPIVSIPSSLVYEPRRSKDGTAVLPKEWKDDE